MHLFPSCDYHIYKLCSFTKISFPEFNCNVVVNENPVLIVAFTSLCYDIIFGADFLDKCGFCLDYNNIFVQWMEYNTPLHNTAACFHTVTILPYLHQSIFLVKTTVLAMPIWTVQHPQCCLQPTPYHAGSKARSFLCLIQTQKYI